MALCRPAVPTYTKAMLTLIEQPRAVPALIVLICLATLATALASQYWGGLQPCILCYYQRYVYMAALAVGALAFLLAGRSAPRRALTGLAGLVFLGGAGLAAFHVGVEQKWWKGTAACHGPVFPENATPAEMREIMLNQAFVACDEIPWELFGISMAGYNVLASLAFAAFCFWAITVLWKGRPA